MEDDDSGGEKKDEAAPKKTKVEINIGSEHIKKMEVKHYQYNFQYNVSPFNGTNENIILL